MTTKILLRGALLVAVVASLGAIGFQQLGRREAATGQAPGTDGQPVVIKALYLHGNFRCETCQSIEAQARRAIAEDFAPQIKAGTLVFAALNIDKPPFEHYGEDFKLSSASLVLTDDRGPSGRWRVLPRTWDLVHDPVAFRDYVRQETRAFLAAAK